MSEQITGLDIGDRLVTATIVHRHYGGKLSLAQAGWEEGPAEASDAQIVQAIRALWKKHRWSSATVCTCLRSQAVAIRHFHFPGISELDLPAALKLEAEEALQAPPDRLRLDWHLTGNKAAPEGGSTVRDIEGVLVAAAKAEVDRHLAILRRAGLYPVILDVGPMAISNLYCALKGPIEGDNSVCLVNLGRRLADIAILYSGGSIYPRIVSSRAADWADAIDYLSANIQDALKFYQFKLRRESIRRLLLCGQVPPDNDFAGRLGNALGVSVEVWNPAGEVSLGLRASRALHDKGREYGCALAASMGLALRTE